VARLPATDANGNTMNFAYKSYACMHALGCRLLRCERMSPIGDSVAAINRLP